MAKKDYSNYSKEELIKIIHKLEKKRYGIVWEDKPETLAQECKTKLPIIFINSDMEYLINMKKTPHTSKMLSKFNSKYASKGISSAYLGKKKF